MSRTIAVAMSGGVDSTVAALLLRKRGHDLVGVYMHNWDDLDETGTCSSQTDYQCVQELCGEMGIPCHRADFVKEYWNHVFSSLLEGVRRGLTPNPDVLCNQHVKFQSLHQWTRDTLGVSTIATGHYARVDCNSVEVRLLRAVDSFKDQTYFLSHISQESLQNTVFPVGHLTKTRVREIAREEGMDRVNQQKESMGLCFVGKRDFNRFISQYVESEPGDFVTLSGKVVGRHEGHHLYTIGQRARLGGHSQPYCVTSKDPHTNTVTVAEGTSHPALYTPSFITLHPHWITCKSRDLFNNQSDGIECVMRHRHQHSLVPCTVNSRRYGLHVTLREPLRAITPGQYAVFYQGDECLGGACIAEPGPSLHKN